MSLAAASGAVRINRIGGAQPGREAFAAFFRVGDSNQTEASPLLTAFKRVVERAGGVAARKVVVCFEGEDLVWNVLVVVQTDVLPGLGYLFPRPDVPVSVSAGACLVSLLGHLWLAPLVGYKYTRMVSSDKPDPQEVSRKRSVAGRRGAQAVKATFGAVITRRRLAELVGVSPNTVRNWELAGALEPRREEILGSPTVVFEPADVEFGLKLIALLRRHNGELTVQQAADLVRAGKPFQP